MTEKLQESLRSDLTDGVDQQQEEDAAMKTNKKENATINPLSLFKEDLSQFKEDVMNVFKDKDGRTTSQSVDKTSQGKTVSTPGRRHVLHGVRDAGFKD